MDAPPNSLHNYELRSMQRSTVPSPVGPASVKYYLNDKLHPADRYPIFFAGFLVIRRRIRSARSKEANSVEWEGKRLMPLGVTSENGKIWENGVEAI